MSQEAAVAVLAVTRIGAVYAPCFSGYGAQAVAARLSGCDAKVLITADAFARRGHLVPMKRTADDAVTDSPSVRHVIVHRRTGADIPWTRDATCGGTTRWPRHRPSARRSRSRPTIPR